MSQVVMGWDGTLSEIPDDWWCPLHHRHLSFGENRRGGCAWCDPRYLPPTVRHDAKGKPLTETEKRREKTCDRVRMLTPEQRAGTAPITRETVFER